MNNKEKTLNFPQNFYWGASTSAHQVEGGNINDWSEWEKKNAERLAGEANNKWQNWQKEKFPEMFEPQNYISGIACDHYNRYKEDFDIAKSLNHNAHRLSIEWSRIEPEEGKFNEKEIEHYRNVISSLKERGIEPFVTLWHWTLPLWVRDNGGWENKKTIDNFIQYAKKISSELKDVKFWIIFNEPEIYSTKSYLQGSWSPNKKSIIKYLNVGKNLIKAHIETYLALKSINQNYNIGIAKNNIHFEDYKKKPINRLFKKFADNWWNFRFLGKIEKHLDFIGLNHYFHNRINYGFNKNENKILNDLGWEIYPKSIYSVLVGLKKYNLPIYITENGLADKDDKNREWFIKETLKNVFMAIKDGVDIRGYLYWSFLDNHEWDKGFWPRFGLVEIDYKTQERKIRPSAKVYAEICKNNELIIKN